MPFVGSGSSPSMLGGSYRPPSAVQTTSSTRDLTSKGTLNSVSTLIPSINSAKTQRAVSNNAKNTANAIRNGSGFSYASQSSGSSGGISDLYALSSQNSALSQSYAREQMSFQQAEAQKNRDWQERMSNTAYQRAVEDLQKAGLNPILAYQNGGASVNSVSTPSGASGNVDNSFISALASLAIASLNSATSLAIADKQASTSLKVSENSMKSSLYGSAWSVGESILDRISQLTKKRK